RTAAAGARTAPARARCADPRSATHRRPGRPGTGWRPAPAAGPLPAPPSADTPAPAPPPPPGGVAVRPAHPVPGWHTRAHRGSRPLQRDGRLSATVTTPTPQAYGRPPMRVSTNTGCVDGSND